MPGLATITEKHNEPEEGEIIESDLEEGEIREEKPKPKTKTLFGKPTAKFPSSISTSEPRPLARSKTFNDVYRHLNAADRDTPAMLSRSRTTNFRGLDTPWREQRAWPEEFTRSRTRMWAAFADQAGASARQALTSAFDGRRAASAGPGPVGAIKEMSPRNYGIIVQRLNNKVWCRETGAGSVEDPKIMWMLQPIDDPEGRVEAIEGLCRDACKEKQVTNIWVRKEDHTTTRTFAVSRTGPWDVEKTVSTSDPHFTVYMGNSCEYTYEGHIYVSYKGGSGVPTHFADTSERNFIKPGDEESISMLDRTSLREKARRLGYI
ncbi:hypothetical protein BDW69DRAFT_189429 [Aspergillus filifer]